MDNTKTPANVPSPVLSTMIRVGSLDRSVAFYHDALGMREIRCETFTGRRFTFAFMGYG